RAAYRVSRRQRRIPSEEGISPACNYFRFITTRLICGSPFEFRTCGGQVYGVWLRCARPCRAPYLNPSYVDPAIRVQYGIAAVLVRHPDKLLCCYCGSGDVSMGGSPAGRLVLVLAFRGRVANDPSTSVMSMIQSILEDEV